MKQQADEKIGICCLNRKKLAPDIRVSLNFQFKI